MNEFDKLDLSTETIRELTGDELREVAGGVKPATLDGCFTPVLPTHYCPTRLNCADPRA